MQACLKAMVTTKMKTLCASEGPLKLSESDLSKLVLPAPGIGILHGCFAL